MTYKDFDCIPEQCEPDQEAPAGHHKPTARNCPVLRRARRTAKASEDLTREIKRLRRDLKRCTRCPLNREGKGCPAIEMVNATIRQAILEVNEEMGLNA